MNGSWTQPAASCSSGQTAYSSFWVGIDGDTTNSVEQQRRAAPANFGSVSFSSCTANGASISSNPNPDVTTMASCGTTKATPSGLGGGGTSFSVTWTHS